MLRRAESAWARRPPSAPTPPALRDHPRPRTGRPGLAARALLAVAFALGGALGADAYAATPEPPPPPSARPDWGVELALAFSHFLYHPVSLQDLPATDAGEGWRDVHTRERYDIGSTALGRLALSLRTPWLRLGIAYATDRAFTFGFGEGDSGGTGRGQSGPTDLLNLVASFDGVPILDRLSLVSQNVWFRNGVAVLYDRRSGEVLDARRFELELWNVEARYALRIDAEARRPGQVNYVFLGRRAQSLPRQLYLVEDGHHRSFSDRLLRVDAAPWLAGFGLELPLLDVAEDSTTGLAPVSDERHRDGLWISGRLGLGGGRYGLFHLDDGARYADDAWAFGGTLSVGLSYAVRPRPWLQVGLRDVVELNFLHPLGIPEDLGVRLGRSGQATAAESLGFGAVDLFNRFEAFIAVEY